MHPAREISLTSKIPKRRKEPQGLLAGIGALAIPGVGPLIAAGPIMATLSGAAAGALVGGLAGALIGLGIPEIEAKQYEGKIKDGNILLSVHVTTSENRDRAKKILEQNDAYDIVTVNQAKAA
jgi:tetrahydromethanopterin S-methyltransferase subunit C